MKILNRKIAVANRFIYYYANFVDKVYGFVTRRDGENIPEEHYVGRILDPAQGRHRGRHHRDTSRSVRSALQWRGDPRHPNTVDRGGRGLEPQEKEIALFLYRKRLLLGTFQARVRGKYFALAAEDGRQVAVRKSAFVYLTGVVDDQDGAVLKSYAASIRELAGHIDLEEVWDLFEGERDEVSTDEIASLYWADELDSSREVALYQHLEHDSPYFESNGPDSYRVVAADALAARRRLLAKRRAAGRDWQEFTAWLGADDDEPYRPEAFTRKQARWLEEIRQYALWGSESTSSRHAREALGEALGIRTPTPQRAFDLLVSKGVWSPDENLDLLREDIPLSLPREAVDAAEAIDLQAVLREPGRKVLRWRRPFAIDLDGDLCRLAFTVRRRLLGGWEVGVHVPDVAALVAPDAPIDRAANDRMGAIRLPDGEVPMLPARLARDLACFHVGRARPALSILWKVDRRLILGKPRLALTTVTLADRVVDVSEGAGGSSGRAVGLLDRMARHLQSGRVVEDEGLPRLTVTMADGAVRIRQVAADDPAQRIVDALSVQAAAAVGRWCWERGVPAIYLTRDPAAEQQAWADIPNPVVRRHERERQTPPETFSSEPGVHAGHGLRALAAVLDPVHRYTDLLVQRQVRSVLRDGTPSCDEGSLALARFRAQEELRQYGAMVYRRSRYLVLKRLSCQVGETFPATALYISRDGVLSELSDLPLKTVVHPPFAVEVGQSLSLRLSGVDLWRGHAHFQVEPAEGPPA